MTCSRSMKQRHRTAEVWQITLINLSKYSNNNIKKKETTDWNLRSYWVRTVIQWVQSGCRNACPFLWGVVINSSNLASNLISTIDHHLSHHLYYTYCNCHAPGIQVHRGDVQHPFPTMLSCFLGAHTGLFPLAILSALKSFLIQRHYVHF